MSNIPNSVTDIGENAFANSENVTIRCYLKSAAYKYAKANSIKVSLLDDIIFGDVDGNKSVEASDALAVLRAVVKLTTLTDTQTAAGDVDGNSKIEANDALLILKKVVKLISTFPVEE